MNSINPIYTSSKGVQNLQQEFQQGVPYKHLVMDNFLEETYAETLFENFPSIELLDKHYKGLNEKKSEGANFSQFHPSFVNLKSVIMSPEFCTWIAEVTQIPMFLLQMTNLEQGFIKGVMEVFWIFILILIFMQKKMFIED